MFDAKGKEENLDLGVHFGFAPQIETGGHYASFFGSQAAGAQIDMRQVYLTAGGTWGQLLMGKELGLFQRGNILNDMTLLGVGVGGGGRGHRARPHRLRLPVHRLPAAAHLLHPGRQDDVALDRPVRGTRSRARYETARAAAGRGRVQLHRQGRREDQPQVLPQRRGPDRQGAAATGTTESLTSTGVGGGATVDIAGFALHASGFYAKGMGSLFMGDACCTGPEDGRIDTTAWTSRGDGRDSFGYIGQITWMRPEGKFGLGASYGENNLLRTDADKAADGTDEEILKRRAIVGQLTYKWSKSLRWVAEYGHIENLLGR